MNHQTLYGKITIGSSCPKNSISDGKSCDNCANKKEKYPLDKCENCIRNEKAEKKISDYFMTYLQRYGY